MVKRMGIALDSNNSSYFLISNTLGGCVGTWTSIRAQCLLLEVSRVYIPASGWVVLVWAHAREYIVILT